jgi:hypothetical protein
MKDSSTTIEKYCGKLEERIQACSNLDVAIELKELLLKELRQHCQQAQTATLLEKQFNGLVKKYFDASGKNTFIRRIFIE